VNYDRNEHGSDTENINFINGKPTGKSFKVPVRAAVHWKDGLMIEESLFRNNQSI
jgi:hypothetical protein